MSGRTVQGAIALLVLGNMLAMFSDIIIKWLGGDIPLFQFVLMRMLCSLILLLPFLGHIDRRILVARTGIHLLRAHVSIFAVVCMVVALTTLPLATANAVFYTGPIIMIALAVAFFGERVTALSLLAALCGFVGIVIALRPVELSWHTLSALGTAFALALNALLVRKLPREHSKTHTLLLTQVYALPAAIGLVLWEGADWDWTLFTAAFGSAAFIMGYHITILLAYRDVPANKIGSAEYTGLIWAVLFGWWWFAEAPDLWFIIGSLLITGPLFVHGLMESRRPRPASLVPDPDVR